VTDADREILLSMLVGELEHAADGLRALRRPELAGRADALADDARGRLAALYRGEGE
jgi:hypothetical protein